MGQMMVLPDYLWGIETWSASNVHRHYQASRLPMRNWNSLHRRVFSRTALQASRLPMRNWNSERDEARCDTFGFQTTYEELKRWRHVSSSKWGGLPDYLWGIETWYGVRGYAHRTELPDYLWGIETVNLHAVRIRISRFQTTYEELKLCFVCQSKTLNTLPDYLWGIETRKHLSRTSSPNNRFQTTYEELKRFTSGSSETSEVCFQTTYEELKRVRKFVGWISFFASRLPMRNWNTSRLRPLE